MARIAFVSPPTMNRAYRSFRPFMAMFPPLSMLPVCAALLAARHEVRLFDSDAEGWNLDDTLQVVRNFQPQAIGLSAMTATMNAVGDFAAQARVMMPGTIIIAGGVHPTALPVETMQEFPAIDAVVRGEGDVVILPLIERLLANTCPHDVPGVAFRASSSEKIHLSSPSLPIRDLDSLPLPAYSLLDYQKYRAYGWNGWTKNIRGPLGSVFTARGCHRNCTFCASHCTLGRGIRKFSSERVLSEIEVQVKLGQIRVLYIQDDTFTVHKNRVVEICEGIIRHEWRLDIMISGRCDEADLDIFRLLKRAGVNWICFGVESGNQGILDLARKRISLEQIRRAFFLAHKAGLNCAGNFMIGLPGETDETFRDTVELACTVPMEYASFAVCIPFPGSDLFDNMRRRGVPLPPWEGFGLMNSLPIPVGGVPAQRLLEMRRQITFRFFLRPAYLLRVAKRFHVSTVARDFIRMGWAIAASYCQGLY